MNIKLESKVNLFLLEMNGRTSSLDLRIVGSCGNFKDYLFENKIPDDQIKILLRYLPKFEEMGFMTAQGYWDKKGIGLEYYGQCPYDLLAGTQYIADVLGWPQMRFKLYFSGYTKTLEQDWGDNGYSDIFPAPEWFFKEMEVPQTRSWDKFIDVMSKFIQSLKENAKKDLQNPDFVQRITFAKEEAEKQIKKLTTQVNDLKSELSHQGSIVDRITELLDFQKKMR